MLIKINVVILYKNFDVLNQNSMNQKIKSTSTRKFTQKMKLSLHFFWTKKIF